ncbi:putative antirepressor protein [Haemophilus parainfluenzae]|uniref:Putative antirepressor protein n=1 Tax=Haemophilus parainfluenzae TaxID=729 RepID=A0A3S4W922_HAEPA|nr:Bro-N domain-containing protein [Haemophilus parainfluenzae]VEI32584.1 putative antirepressor protein [Haemophilus parainfluenzae]
MTTLTFQNTTLSVINQNNQTFLTASDLGKALDYSDADRSVRRLYTANADEFTPEMTALVEMQTAGGLQKVRIFSLRGAHLIAMFARTKIAKDFRKWVLDVLDKEANQPQQKTAVDDRAGLRNAVSFLVNKKGLIYSEVYQLIHQQFGVEHIDELSQEQLSQAIKYIHFLTLNLDGLFKKGEEVIIPEYIFDAIMKHAKLAQKLAEKVIYYQEKQFALLGIARHYRSNELTSRANSLLSEFSYFLHEGEKLLAQQIENPSLTQIKKISFNA